MKALAGLAVLLATAGSAAAQTNCGDLPRSWEGQAYAASGDTLGGMDLKSPIRLWGIRAPELAADPSMPAMRARAALADMLMSGGNRVSCRMTGWDRECRAVAQCTIAAEWPAGSKAQPHDLALRVIEDGFAWGFGLDTPPIWDKDASGKMAHFETLSRQARKGLWPHWLGEPPKSP
jgi:endonuclease YncB( thermonuclease family)